MSRDRKPRSGRGTRPPLPSSVAVRERRRRRSALRSMAGLGLLLGFVTSAGPARDTEVWTGELEPGARLRVFTPRGKISVQATDGRTGRVSADVRRRGDGAEFEVLRDGPNLTICVVTAKVRSCTAEGLETYRHDDHDEDAVVDLDVALPRGVDAQVVSQNGDVRVNGADAEVQAGSGNGRVDVEGSPESVKAWSGNGRVSVFGARGPIEAWSGNGDVSIATTRGPASAWSGNGDVRARIESLGARADMKFTTGNGDIELEVPEDFSAELEVDLGHGDLLTDFPLRLEGRMSRHHIRASVGEGGPRVRLHTGNGDVELRRI